MIQHFDSPGTANAIFQRLTKWCATLRTSPQLSRLRIQYADRDLKLIRIDIDRSRLPACCRPALGIVADAKPALAALHQASTAAISVGRRARTSSKR